MTAQATHWLEYGEPIEGTKRVKATHRITHETGPREQREDEVTQGTLHMDALDIGWGENHENAHVHEDGSLCLSTVDEQTRERIMSLFDPDE
jgi:hypothetical protein